MTSGKRGMALSASGAAHAVDFSVTSRLDALTESIVSEPDDPYPEIAKEQIERWEQQGPGYLAQVGDFLLWPVQQAAEALIPPGVQDAVGNAIADFLSGLGRASRLTIDCDEVRGRVAEAAGTAGGHPLKAADDAAQHYWSRHIAYAVAEGGATGAVGLPGLAADIPALMTLSLRLIQQVGTCYGFDVHTDIEHEYVLQVLRTGCTGDIKAKLEFLIGLKQVEQILLKVAWKRMNRALAQKELSRLATLAAIRQFAKTLGVQITKRKALQTVPIIGGLVGASFNGTFMNDVGRAAYMNYRRRWIAYHATI